MYILKTKHTETKVENYYCINATTKSAWLLQDKANAVYDEKDKLFTLEGFVALRPYKSYSDLIINEYMVNADFLYKNGGSKYRVIAKQNDKEVLWLTEEPTMFYIEN